MNAVVSRKIGGRRVAAKPVYRRDRRGPVYWTAEVNDRTLPQTFASAPEVFNYVADAVGHGGRA